MNSSIMQLLFPPVSDSDEDGLIAIGGDLSPERLLLAYRSGIFPWFNEGDPILWWSPDPRCVLFPEKLHVSKSMKQVLAKNHISFTMNRSFETVMRNCATVKRKDGHGTWISEEMVQAYTTLHKLGYAISAEAWEGQEMVGGLYGVLIGQVFFGESMFSKKSNASKFAFIQLIDHLHGKGIQLIDCQMRTDHLLSLGAEMIDRKTFLELLKKLC